MKRALRLLFLFAVAALAGAAASAAIYRSPAARALIAQLCGIESDAASTAGRLQAAAQTEPVSEEQIERELDLLRAEFGDDNSFLQALSASHLSLGQIRTEVADHLRARSWIEKQIAPQLGTGREEDRKFYQEHLAQFLQPQRYRVSHLFLAAPNGSTPEIVATKQSAIEGLSVRLLAGESLAQLIGEASEDGATKTRSGDLGYFAATRMPPEFITEVEKLQIGETSGPIQSHLGFHIIQLTDAKPLANLTFEQAQPEIATEITNRKRAAAVAQLNSQLKARRAW
jgi:parvulin-like peptidyl-prolyl isomerase